MKIIVAVSQYDVPESTKNSLLKLNEVAKNASSKKAQLLVAPETAIGMLSDVKTASSDYLPELKKICQENHLAIATSFYTKEGQNYFNQGYIVSSDRKILHKHRKIYLAPPERNKDEISGGQGLEVSRTDLGKLGMLICKDGFNKYSHYLYEELGNKGTDIICIPTWSLTWDELDTQEYIKSMFVYGAFMSRSFVLVSGNLNKDTKSFGRSLIISPASGVLQEGSQEREELLVQEIDLDEVKKARDFDKWWQPQKHEKCT